MKSHLLLLRTVLNDMGTRCCTSTSLDLKRIEARVKHEGLSYLTIALPNFCKDFEKSLSIGKVDSTVFAGYAKNGCLPAFLGGFTSLVFDRKSGLLLDAPSIDAILAVRQITRLYSKVNLPCSDARTEAAFDKYIECEKQVRESDRLLDHSDLERFKTMSNIAWGDVLCELDREVYNGTLIPGHGPGATADRLKGNRKYNQFVWTERLENGFFPHGEYLFTSWSHFLDSPDVILLEPGAEIPVRVITVPKTLKTPRIIAIEPTCMQYAQQAILRSLVPAIQNHKFRKELLMGRLVGFDDQTPNREMARLGSITGTLATLDLSEASDRVSNQLVRTMLCNTPFLAEAVDACRSRKADVPGRGVIRLAKYASMGSALCFPIEAMVFTTCVLLGVQKELNRPLRQQDICNLVGQVRIYGDDIVVPVEYVRSVIDELQTFGFVINIDKSFWTGKFRESCGGDYYDGYDVSVVKATTVLPTSRRHVPEIVATVALRNQMYFAGNWETAAMLDELLSEYIPMPVVGPKSPALGRQTFLPQYSEDKVCPNLQTPLVKGAVVSPVIPPDHLEGHGALLKVFLNQGEPFVDERHLERAGRPVAVNIKHRYVSPF